jgi:Tfp pilus assembly protein PilX
VLVTVVIMAVVFSLVGMVGSQVLVTDSATTISNVDYQQALQSAQSGVDAAYQRIESEASVKTAPCGATAVRGTLGSAPRSSSYSVTATYFSTLTARTKLACSSLSAASKATTLPKAVLLTSTGKDGTKSARVVSEADIAVSPLGSVFGDAAYIGAGFTVSGADAFDTPTKTVYVNGSVKCGSGGSMTGTLVATGNMTLTGNCKIAGNAKAGGAISIPSGSPSVGGTLVSFSTATPGIDIAGNPTLHGVVAKTKITTPSWWPGTHPAAHIVEDDSSLGSLTTQTFPKVIWTPSGWVASGYRALNAGSTCAKVYKAMFAMHTASTATGTSKPVALYTSCKVTLPQRHPNCPSWQTAYYCTKLVLARNLVVLSTAGFDLPTPANVSVSTAGATHQLGLIVPTDKSTGSPVSCTGTNGLITFTGKIYTGVDTLFYTPCKISMTGSAKVVEGEIYAGSTYTAENGMAFGSPLTVAGASGGSRSVAGKASVGVLFVRQAS